MSSRRGRGYYQNQFGRMGVDWVFLIFMAMLTLMPFLWVVSTSLRKPVTIVHCSAGMDSGGHGFHQLHARV